MSGNKPFRTVDWIKHPHPLRAVARGLKAAVDGLQKGRSQLGFVEELSGWRRAEEDELHSSPSSSPGARRHPNATVMTTNAIDAFLAKYGEGSLETLPKDSYVRKNVSNVQNFHMGSFTISLGRSPNDSKQKKNLQ